MITIDISQIAGLDKKLKALTKEKIEQINDEIERASYELEKTEKETITRNGSVRSGQMRLRVATTITTDRSGNKCGVIGTSVHYAKYVEYGTRKMKAKPFVRPSVQKVEVKYIGNIKKILGV